MISVNASGTLPIVRLPPTNLFVTMRATDGANSHFDLSLKDIPQGYDITNGTYLGWCAQMNMAMTRGVNHTVRLYSSYDPQMPPEYQSENWPKINYVLNHKQGDRYSIQEAIWYYTDQEGYPSDPDAQAMIADADQNGMTFVPSNGEIIAILVEGVQEIQRAFLELIIPTSSLIGHLVWYDSDEDGIQDQEEPGITKVTVNIYSKDNILIDSTITNDKGYYLYTNIATGEYYIQFVLPTGYQFSPQDAGMNDTIDSDANTSTGKTTLFNVGTNESNSNWDAGMHYLDSNGNGDTTPGTGGSTSYGSTESTTNHAPTADATGGEPYNDFTNREITFNGNRSYDRDGTIISWYWDFGDGTNGSGDIVKHSYSMPGNYTVVLTVTDDDGATDSYATIAMITFRNIPPTKPVLSGPITGHKNTLYEYSVVSTDQDEDPLKYIFNWGDDNITTTETFPNGTTVFQNHSWGTAGRYTIVVKSLDNITESVSTKLIMLIDVLEVVDIGYLIDENSDGIYDFFHNTEIAIGKETKVKMLNNGNYLIDSDGDNTWDYDYNPIANELNIYHEDSTLFYLIICILLIAFILIFLVLEKIRRSK